MSADKDSEALTACTDFSPSLYLGGDRSVLNKTAQRSAKLSPF